MKTTASVLALSVAVLLVPTAAHVPTAQAATPRTTVVSLTFDDGTSDQLQALPALRRHGFKGTFYVNSARVGESSNRLTRSDLLALQGEGHEIAGHTLDHVDMTATSLAENRRQVCDDRVALTRMGLRITSFAYPFGNNDATAQQVVRECGYNSARRIANLRSNPYGCSSCPTAETIPPANRWAVRTNTSVQRDTTLAGLEGYVTQAENGAGGWVPIVVHHIGDGTTSTTVTRATFDAFVDWLARRPSTTTVRTVDQVVGGAVKPAVTSSQVGGGSAPPSSSGSVTIGTASRALTGTDVSRTADALVRYTPASGSSTGTNVYGYEAAVVGGKVTRVADGTGNMSIPGNGYVLSGHGDSRTWLAAHARVGATVTLQSG